MLIQIQCSHAIKLLHACRYVCASVSLCACRSNLTTQRSEETCGQAAHAIKGVLFTESVFNVTAFHESKTTVLKHMKH